MIFHTCQVSGVPIVSLWPHTQVHVGLGSALSCPHPSTNAIKFLVPWWYQCNIPSVLFLFSILNFVSPFALHVLFCAQLASPDITGFAPVGLAPGLSRAACPWHEAYSSLHWGNFSRLCNTQVYTHMCKVSHGLRLSVGCCLLAIGSSCALCASVWLC